MMLGCKMLVIYNTEAEQTTTTYYLPSELSPTSASLLGIAPIRPSAVEIVAADMRV